MEEKDISNDIEVPSTENFISRSPQKQRQLIKNNENKYSCDQCNHVASNQGNLKKHIKTIHDGVKYPCDQCNHKASDPSNLRQHIKSIHDGVKFPCQECNYQATQMISLQKHILSIHKKANFIE